MNVAKNVTCESIDEFISSLKKIREKKALKSVNFNGNVNCENDTEVVTINWVEEEGL